jgi:hypothetical protein
MNNKEFEFVYINIFIFRLKSKSDFPVVNKIANKKDVQKRVFQKGRRNDLE